MTLGFVLSAPWGLFDTASAAGGGRRIVLPGGNSTITINAGPPVITATLVSLDLRVEARSRGIEPEGPEFAFGQARYRNHIIDVGTRPNEMSIGLLDANNNSHRIEYSGFIPRPGFAAGKQGSAPASIRALELDNFVFSCIERIRSAIDVEYGKSGWDALDIAWSDEYLDPVDPPRELIVKHAEKFPRQLDEIFRSPRRLLSRDREKTAIDRVQQIDVACIRWLTRQPGRNIYEQAGPQQEILAVVRNDKLDILENRVLRDFLGRSVAVAQSYCDRYVKRKSTNRWKLVNRYRMQCHRHERFLQEAGVGLPIPPIVPNYALLRESRYSRIWEGYRALLRRLNDQDECWRWQHRLWADVTRLAVQLAVRRQPEVEIIAETPFRIFEEQQRGRWTSLKGQSGAYLLKVAGQPRRVCSVVVDLSEEHQRIPEWIVSLCPAAVIVVDDLGTGRSTHIIVWAMHSCSADQLSIDTIVESADRSLSAALQQENLLSGESAFASGVVLLSAPSVDRSGPKIRKKGSVIALVLGPSGDDLKFGLSKLAETLVFESGVFGSIQ